MSGLAADLAYLVALIAGDALGYLLGLFVLFTVTLALRDMLAAYSD